MEFGFGYKMHLLTPGSRERAVLITLRLGQLGERGEVRRVGGGERGRREGDSRWGLWLQSQNPALGKE